MSEERKKILEMLSSGKISVDEAEKLLSALSQTDTAANGQTRGKSLPKYLRVLVEPAPGYEKGERVNIRVPLKLIRAGLKLASVIPQHAQIKVNEALADKGIKMDFNHITPQDLDDLVMQLDDLTVDVEGKETVKIFCE